MILGLLSTCQVNGSWWTTLNQNGEPSLSSIGIPSAWQPMLAPERPTFVAAESAPRDSLTILRAAFEKYGAGNSAIEVGHESRSSRKVAWDDKVEFPAKQTRDQAQLPVTTVTSWLDTTPNNGLRRNGDQADAESRSARVRASNGQEEKNNGRGKARGQLRDKTNVKAKQTNSAPSKTRYSERLVIRHDVPDRQSESADLVDNYDDDVDAENGQLREEPETNAQLRDSYDQASRLATKPVSGELAKKSDKQAKTSGYSWSSNIDHGAQEKKPEVERYQAEVKSAKVVQQKYDDEDEIVSGRLQRKTSWAPTTTQAPERLVSPKFEQLRDTEQIRDTEQEADTESPLNKRQGNLYSKTRETEVLGNIQQSYEKPVQQLERLQEEPEAEGEGDENHSCRLQDSIPGEPESDYPTLTEVPETLFKCSDQEFPGYYGDVEARCQVFHVCQADGRKDSFLCPIGTIFNQQLFVCDWWTNFRCEDTPSFYELNAELYVTPQQSAQVPNNQVSDQLRKRSGPRSAVQYEQEKENDFSGELEKEDDGQQLSGNIEQEKETNVNLNNQLVTKGAQKAPATATKSSRSGRLRQAKNYEPVTESAAKYQQEKETEVSSELEKEDDDEPISGNIEQEKETPSYSNNQLATKSAQNAATSAPKSSVRSGRLRQSKAYGARIVRKGVKSSKQRQEYLSVSASEQFKQEPSIEANETTTIASPTTTVI
ncbi:hypothetical protein HDE_10563 [Halotydeus destructor]|nr:hypothetical protein HDE_10563 [Halotydeus destructor]